MKKLIILSTGLLLLLFQFSCRGQIVKKSQRIVNTVSDTSVNIIDPVEFQPFDIKRKTIYSVLPDSLGGKKAKGISGLKLIINKNGGINNFIIIKLSILKEGNKIIDFWNENSDRLDEKDYSSDVLKYYPFFEKYVHSLKIVPNKGVKPEQKNILYIMVRF